MRRASRALAILAALFWPARVQAHGRFPEAGSIVFHPGDPAMIVAGTSYGLLVTRDGGSEWRWICQPAIGGSLYEDPTVVVTTSGDLVAGVLRGMRRGTGRGCVWDYPEPELRGRYPIDTVRDPTRVARLLTVTSTGGDPNAVWSSDDEGISWTPLSEEMPDILFETLRIAPSDPSYVYSSGAIPDDPVAMTPRQLFVSASTDGGMHFVHHELAAVGTEDGVELLGVDPADPLRLYAATVNEEDERVLVSEDGGMSFRDLVVLPEVRAFAQTADGETVWVGGDRNAGLHRSDDHGARFERVASAEIQVLCLALRDDELWACADQPLDHFTIGVSRDRGASFEPVLHTRDIAGPVTCADGAAGECPALWPDIAHDLGVPGFSGDGGAAIDAGDPRLRTPGGGGCACRAGGAAPLGSAPAGIAILLGLALCCARWEVSWGSGSRRRR